MRNQVFISYRHENPEHSAAVWRLGTMLREANIPVVLDQFFLEEYPGGPDIGWPKWCDDCAKDSTCVLIIASEGWFAAFEHAEPGQGKGARFEADLIRQALYDEDSNARIRLAFLQTLPAERIPPRLRPWQHFRPFEAAEELDRLICWISGRLGLQGVQAPIVRWPAPIPFELEFADRSKKEWPAIRSLLTGQTRERILLIQGVSGLGKSELVRHAKFYAKKLGILIVHVDFKGGRLSTEDVLATFDLDLGQHLPTFSRERPMKTHLLRKDLRALRKPALLIFDSYEDVADNQAVADWLNLSLLPEVETGLALAVIVAGKRVPDPAVASWRDWAQPIELEPIRDCQAWAEWVSRRYPNFDGDLPTLVKASKGLPALMAMICANVART